MHLIYLFQLLYQDSTVPVTYKYSLPTNVQPGSEYETYAWTFDEYTPCTETCGGGKIFSNFYNTLFIKVRKYKLKIKLIPSLTKQVFYTIVY